MSGLICTGSTRPPSAIDRRAEQLPSDGQCERQCTLATEAPGRSSDGVPIQARTRSKQLRDVADLAEPKFLRLPCILAQLDGENYQHVLGAECRNTTRGSHVLPSLPQAVEPETARLDIRSNVPVQIDINDVRRVYQRALPSVFLAQPVAAACQQEISGAAVVMRLHQDIDVPELPHAMLP